jgi:hypothetical protein
LKYISISIMIWRFKDGGGVTFVFPRFLRDCQCHAMVMCTCSNPYHRKKLSSVILTVIHILPLRKGFPDKRKWEEEKDQLCEMLFNYKSRPNRALTLHSVALTLDLTTSLSKFSIFWTNGFAYILHIIQVSVFASQ